MLYTDYQTIRSINQNRLPCQLPCFFMRLGMGSSVQLIDTLPFSQKPSCQLVQILPRQEFVPTRFSMRPGGVKHLHGGPYLYFPDIYAPRRGWDLWRFASLIPSGCRLPPIHKVMGDHASRGYTPAGALMKRWHCQIPCPSHCLILA